MGRIKLSPPDPGLLKTVCVPIDFSDCPYTEVRLLPCNSALFYCHSSCRTEW